MATILIKNATLVNEGLIAKSDVLIAEGIIQQIGSIEPPSADCNVINAEGKYLLPGVIDGQVHFREPGQTQKADLRSESRAAVAGGTTSFIDMPNTVPNTLNIDLLEEKYRIASEKSLANYSFFLGVNEDNIDDVLATDTHKLMGVSDDGLYFTKKGNLLADNPATLEKLFANCPSIIAIHSEKEKIVEANEAKFREKYGDDLPAHFHPEIRSEKACYESSEQAIALAKKHGARFHILHLSTEKETHLFRNDIPLDKKKITTEVSIHHLWFSDKDYERLGMLIKWNPAIKTEKDRQGLMQALLDDRIDFITTDHAPHALSEKQKPYFESMSGAPMVQHSLNCMLEFYKQGVISLEKIVEKMCHAPAKVYRMKKRGFIKEGFYADLVLVDMNKTWKVDKGNILYKCGWSPLEGTEFSTLVEQTFVNGHLAYDNGNFNEQVKGMAIEVDTAIHY